MAIKTVASLVQNDAGLFLVFNSSDDLQEFIKANSDIPAHVVCFGQYENALEFNVSADK